VAVITNYETLLTAIGDYLARDDLSAFAPNFAQNWEERFYRQPQNWGPWMELALSLTLSSGVAEVPEGFLGLKLAYVDSSPSWPLQRVSSQMLYRKYPRGMSTGQPVMIARDQGNFVFGPVPDSDYTISGTYYAKPTLLRDLTTGVNWMITNAPDLVLYGSLLEAEPFLKNDGRIAVWRDFYTDALADYRDLVRDEDTMGSPIQAQLA
jgi:hypothetical protein